MEQSRLAIIHGIPRKEGNIHTKKITPQRLEKMLDQYYTLLDSKALNKACPKQKEIIINRNNSWHKRTLKQLRLEKFARFEEYRKDGTKTENNTKYSKR